VKNRFQSLPFKCNLQRYTEGHKLWAAYRAFELSQLETATKAKEPKDIAKGEERVRALLHRQLVVPHAQMEETKEMAEAWEQARPAPSKPLLPAAIVGGNAKAAAAAATRRPHEDTIAAAAASTAMVVGGGDTTATPLSKAYRAYIAMEEAAGDPSRAQCVYERAVGLCTIPNQLTRGLNAPGLNP
jgi:hypothetical protein